MDGEHIRQLRVNAVRRYQQACHWLVQLSPKARIVLALFLLAAFLTALHTLLAGTDSSLHVTVQHSFRTADFSLWIDDNLALSGKLAGTTKRKLGILPGSVQGTLSEIVPISSGTHSIRVLVESEDGSRQQDSLTGDFARDSQRELAISARPSGLSLAWRASGTPSGTSSSGWFARNAGALFLTIAGSIFSALTGFALKELPAHLRSRESAVSKDESTVAGA